MGHDKTPERNNLIFFYTMLSVVTLIALGFVFKSYFVTETEQELAKQVWTQPTTERDKVKAAQLEELHSGPVPIEQAMKELAEQGRDGVPVVKPEPSQDVGALDGWNQLHDKPEIPAPLMPGAAPEAAGPDAGVAPAPDSGVAPTGSTGDTTPSPAGENGPKPSAEGTSPQTGGAQQ